MNILYLFGISVLAAEPIISPLPQTPIGPLFDDASAHPPVVTQTQKTTFGTLLEDFRIPIQNQIAVEQPSAAGSSTPPVTQIPTGQAVTPTGQVQMDYTLTPTPPVRKTRSPHMTIALLGDSMVDTLGPDIPNLKASLTSLYPSTEFTLLNYGVGGTNIDYGLERLTNDYTYLGKPIPSLVSVKPDLVVVESFGYNPLSYNEGALDHQWLTLDAIVKTLEEHLPQVKVVIAATIAPNADVFGDGAPNLSYTPYEKQERVALIKTYLENATRYAKSQHLPLADVYHPSLDSRGNGTITYINPGDHIHYSDSGRTFFAKILSDTIITNTLLE